MKSKESLGYAIKMQLFCMGKTQTWLAKQTGVTHSHISCIINNRYAPSLSLLKRLSIALNIDIRDLKTVKYPGAFIPHPVYKERKLPLTL